MGVDSAAPQALAVEVQRAVYDRTALWCSIGVGDNKLRAKLATGFAKPAGVFLLTGDNWDAVMEGRSTEALWGIGAKTARKLAALGIRTVAELAGADEGELVRAFGPNTGPWLAQLARGKATSEVSAEPRVARGHGKERTYQQDLKDPEEIRRELSILARELAGELAGQGREAVRILVKVRFAPFFTKSHSVTLPEPAVEPGAIERGALAALDRFDLDRPVRLLGVRAELAPP
jgi:DNA polymerase-4